MPVEGASIALIGLRQVRDYALREEDRRALSWLGATSPLNVTAEAIPLVPAAEEKRALRAVLRQMLSIPST